MPYSTDIPYQCLGAIHSLPTGLVKGQGALLLVIFLSLLLSPNYIDPRRLLSFRLID